MRTHLLHYNRISLHFRSYKGSNQAYDLKKLSGMETQPHKPLPRLPILTTRISIVNLKGSFNTAHPGKKEKSALASFSGTTTKARIKCFRAFLTHKSESLHSEKKKEGGKAVFLTKANAPARGWLGISVRGPLNSKSNIQETKTIKSRIGNAHLKGKPRTD